MAHKWIWGTAGEMMAAIEGQTFESVRLPVSDKLTGPSVTTFIHAEMKNLMAIVGNFERHEGIFGWHIDGPSNGAYRWLYVIGRN